MKKIQVFDPVMCCSTGVCGPNVDPALVRFSADLDWLADQGIEIERYNLAQEPQAFAANEAVKKALQDNGIECLPLVLVDGRIASQGAYPSRSEMATWLGLSNESSSIFTPAVAELVAIGAAVASNCEPCFRFHYDKAHRLGVSNDDMLLAVKTAQSVKEVPAGSILNLALRYLGPEHSNTAPNQSGCCGSSETTDRKGCC